MEAPSSQAQADEGDSDGRRSLVSRIGEVASRVGLRRTTAQIYAVLLLSEEPMSLDDIASAVGVSKASVSIYARELASLGAIRKVWAPDTRRDLYEAEGDVLKVLRLWAQSGLARRIAEIGAALMEVESYLDSLEAGGRPSQQRVRKRIHAARALHGKLSGMLALLPKLLGGGAEPGDVG
ncbi:GbsR/MarR family transcriptional regulator [Planctomycetota bacterium]